jgi:hypothetical protein
VADVAAVDGDDDRLLAVGGPADELRASLPTGCTPGGRRPIVVDVFRFGATGRLVHRMVRRSLLVSGAAMTVLVLWLGVRGSTAALAVAVAVLVVAWGLALRPSQRSVDAAALQLAHLGVRFDSSRRPIDPATSLAGAKGRAPSAQRGAATAARFDAALAIVRRGALTGRRPSPHLLELLAERTDEAIELGRERRSTWCVHSLLQRRDTAR